MPYDTQHLPVMLRAVYANRPPRMVVLLRDPVERLHSAFYGWVCLLRVWVWIWSFLVISSSSMQELDRPSASGGLCSCSQSGQGEGGL